MHFLLFSLTILLFYHAATADIGRGAQVRLTKKGMLYAASIGVKKLQDDLTNKRVDSQSGNSGDISWSASNIVIQYFRIGSYDVQPLQNVGLRLSIRSVSVSASGRVSAKYRKGWVKVSDSTNVKISGSNIAFNLDFKIDARNGKPYAQATSCSTSIGNLDLDFSGDLGWLYDAIASLFSGKLKDVLKKVICNEATGLINKKANNFFTNFPVQQNIDNVAVIDYSFERPAVTSAYLDLMLRGEFLDPKDRKHGANPPSFVTSSSLSSKMTYVWLSEYTLNSAGDIMHKTGLLKKLIGPLMNEIPADVKPFLNTNSFQSFIPELYKRFPNRPLEFQVQTNEAPKFEIQQGKINVFFNVRATVIVDKSDGSKISVFYLDLNVNASGSVFVKSINSQLNVGGNIADFTFNVKIGGSVIGDISIPLDDPSIKQLVKGLIIENANPVLNKGFPIPKIKNLDFTNPQVSFVKDAIRVDTDIAYRG